MNSVKILQAVRSAITAIAEILIVVLVASILGVSISRFWRIELHELDLLYSTRGTLSH